MAREALPTWNWNDFCPAGLNISANSSSILTDCYQQFFIQIPIYSLIAIFSSYNYGKLSVEVLRNRRQIICLYLRALVSLALATSPLIKLLWELQNGMKIWPADILVSCIQALSWTVHFTFILANRRLGTLSHRGPLILLMLYCCSLSLSILWYETNKTVFSEISIALNLLYAATLVPNGKSQFIVSESRREREPLINAYHRLSVDGNEDSWILGSAHDGHNFLSRLIFYWVNPLIRKGYLGKLRKNEDLFDLPECLNIRKNSEKLQRHLSAGKTLFSALHRSFGVEFYLIGLLRLFSDLSNFGGPLLLGALLNSSEDENNAKAYYFAGGLFITSLISSISGVHFNWKISIVSSKMRTSMVSAIYSKSLMAKGLHDAKSEILNLMSTDTDRIVNSCISFHSFWSIPFQLFTTLYLLYVQLKFAFIPGVIFAIILIPINRYIALKIGSLSSFLMSAKDKRVQLTAEALTGAKQIKMQALEDIFVERIEALRKDELKYLAKRKYLDAWCVYFWATTPVMMCLLTFGVMALFGQKLTASTTYTSVALLNLLIGPLNAFPWVLNGLMEAFVSLKRVQELVDLENIDFNKYYTPMTQNYTKSSSDNPVVVSISNGSFCFEKKRDRAGVNVNVEDVRDHKLENVNVEIKQGELVCIDGLVGSGKTMLINAIIGNLKKTHGVVSIKDNNLGFGYVSQTPWLQRGTIRENICFGTIYDESRYQAVIKCCALMEDIEKLGGDNIGVGEGGRTLSGGQKARVSLARAVYQEKQIYVLDDFLSALDAHVAAHIVKYCIFGFLLKKTRIIVTQNKTLLEHANQIIQVNDGTVSCIDLMNEEDEFSDDELDYVPSRRNTLQIEPDRRSLDSCLGEEIKEFGHINSSVISCYWRSMGRVTGFFVIFCVFTMQLSRNVTDGWLAHWVSMETISNVTNSTNFYLETFTSFALGNTVLTLIRSFLFAYAGIKAAKIVHNKLLNRVFYTKLQFYDVTSLGRILNRFSSDTYTIDDTLPFIFNILLAQLFGLLGAIFVSLFALPWLGLVIAPLVPIYLDIQSKYRNASRDIRRISSNALSPLYAQFTESLQGLSTIRAMRASNRFKQDFAVKLEESIRAQLTASAASNWLAIRLQLLGAVIVGGAGLLTVMTSAHSNSPGMVGLAISYALSISGLLGGYLVAFTETEQEMIAVERVGQYLELPPETNYEGTIDPPFAWPHQGVIQFKNVSMNYRENLAPALNSISFETASYERIGIVGRTGAGKSSIINALLRVSNLTRGQILIDNVDIKTLPLNVLRSRVAIITQDPFLFEGTVRDNIDPRGVFLDSEIWNAISHSMTNTLVQEIGGLYGKVEACGSNLSAGQRQLLCLTRALLRSAKIVLIDEATSNLDSESELGVNIALKNAFKTATVLVVAHRLNGLQNSDRIFVISNGNIVETGDFWTLAKNENTYFYQMLREQKSNLLIQNI